MFILYDSSVFSQISSSWIFHIIVLRLQKWFYIKWTSWLKIFCLNSTYTECIYKLLEKCNKPVHIIFLFKIKICINQLKNKITIHLNIFLGEVEKKNRSFKTRSRNSHMPAVSGPRTCTGLEISGPRIWDQKWPEWCSFWGHTF